MQQPNYLKKGDIVRIISTARKIDEQKLQLAIETMKGWGLSVQLGENIFAEHHQFAGDDDQRLSDFQNALDDPEVSLILFARGGYGTIRIIDRINWEKFAKQPKWLAGFSDITVVHNHVNRLGISETLHSTMPISFAENTNESLESLRMALSGELLAYSIEGNELNRFGNSEGELVGGNLSILYNLLGTNSDIDTEGKVLLLEDLDEYLYHVDRMMQALRKSGKLDGLKGLIVGGLSDMNDNEVSYGKTASQIVCEAVQDFDFPVCFAAPVGHVKDNRTFVLGRSVNLTVTPKEVKISF